MTAGTEQDRNVNLANRLANRLPRVYQVLDPAGWRRGYAADCKSTPARSNFSNSFNALPHLCGFANMRGQTGNETKIFQTALAKEASMTIPGYDDWRLRGPDDDRCPDCDGSGEHDCLNCGGDGEVSNGLECPCCDGTGLVDCETCRRDEPDGDYLYERARDLRMEKETW